MRDVIWASVMVLGISGSALVAGYKYGSMESYKVFGVEFKKQVTAAYWDGYGDGGASCERHHAIQQGSSM